MKHKVVVLYDFERAAKRLQKRYRSFKNDLQQLVESLKVNPLQGTALAANLRKIRLAVGSKGRGKSGGARIITYVALIEETVYLLTVYDKSDTDSIPLDELRRMLRRALRLHRRDR